MKNLIFRAAWVGLISMIFFVSPPVSSAVWKPIIGIPKPPFGIDEVAPVLPSPWNSDVSGYYYVQSGGANSGNGYPGNPRSQIPNPVPAGAVVVISGTYTTKHEEGDAITINGTSAKPVFIKGGSSSSHGVFNQKVEFIGSYYIIEYMDGAWSNSSGNGKLNFGGDHGVVRHGDFRGDTDDGIGGVNTDGSYMVIWDSSIHDSGNLSATYDQDNHGTAIGAGDHIWIVHNRYYANSGDGIQLNGNTNSDIQYVYIGGNISHGNKQTGMWTKNATDVIFSQNTVFGHRESNSSMGDGMGMQYAPEYVWFIFNTIYDNECGIRLASDSGGAGTHHYIIGNLIYNIHKRSPYNIDDSWETAAIAVWGSTYTEVVNNTIWDVDAGINSPRDKGTLNIVNNILGSPTISGANTVWYYVEALKNSSTGSNNLFGLNSRIKIGSSSTYSYDQVGWPNGLQSGSPGFIDQVGGNYNIAVDSPAKDAGALYQVYSVYQQRYGIDIAKDIAQRPRPQGAGWDIGAYEYSTSAVGSPPQPPRNLKVLN